MESPKITFTCNEVHLRCTFENVTKYRYFVICFFSVIIFADCLLYHGRCHLHFMVPGSNLANKNSCLINMSHFNQYKPRMRIVACCSLASNNFEYFFCIT